MQTVSIGFNWFESLSFQTISVYRNQNRLPKKCLKFFVKKVKMSKNIGKFFLIISTVCLFGTLSTENIDSYSAIYDSDGNRKIVLEGIFHYYNNVYGSLSEIIVKSGQAWSWSRANGIWFGSGMKNSRTSASACTSKISR